MRRRHNQHPVWQAAIPHFCLPGGNPCSGDRALAEADRGADAGDRAVCGAVPRPPVGCSFKRRPDRRIEPRPCRFRRQHLSERGRFRFDRGAFRQSPARLQAQLVANFPMCIGHGPRDRLALATTGQIGSGFETVPDLNCQHLGFKRIPLVQCVMHSVEGDRRQPGIATIDHQPLRVALPAASLQLSRERQPNSSLWSQSWRSDRMAVFVELEPLGTCACLSRSRA